MKVLYAEIHDNKVIQKMLYARNGELRFLFMLNYDVAFHGKAVQFFAEKYLDEKVINMELHGDYIIVETETLYFALPYLKVGERCGKHIVFKKRVFSTRGGDIVIVVSDDISDVIDIFEVFRK